MHVDVKIEDEICTGCGACINSCPTDVIRMDAGKARVAYPADCQGCFLCEFDCPVDAILVFPQRYRTRGAVGKDAQDLPIRSAHMTTGPRAGRCRAPTALV